MSTNKVGDSKEIHSAGYLKVKPEKAKIPLKFFIESKTAQSGLAGRASIGVSKTPQQENLNQKKIDSVFSKEDEDQYEKEVRENPDDIVGQIEALDIFANAYYELAEKETAEMETEITIQFSNLNIKTQMLIRNCIERILIKNDPDLSREALEETVDAVIHNPFVEVNHPSNWRASIIVLPAAIIDTRNMVQRVMQKFERRAISFNEVAQVARSLDFSALDSDNEA